jgi:hypothetical protein
VAVEIDGDADATIIAARIRAGGERGSRRDGTRITFAIGVRVGS